MSAPAAGGAGGAGFRPSEPLGSFYRTARGVLLSPARFFRAVPPRGPVGGAVLFALVCALVALPLTVLSAPLNPLLAGDGAEDLLGPWRAVAEGAGSGAAFVALLAALVLIPAFALLGIYLAALFLHLFVWAFVRPGRPGRPGRPSRAGFGATLKASCYPGAAALFSWVPVVGLAASAYGLYLTFVGVRELHSTTNARALLAVVPLALFSFSGQISALGSALLG